MTQITKEHIDFMEEAKRAFASDDKFDTHRNDDETLIALRTGGGRGCILIYRLDGCVANFTGQLAPVDHPGYKV